MSTPHKIPTLAELHADNPDAFANDKLKTLLNMAPNMMWVKKHPMTGMPYMPVDKVDHLLDRIYARWELEIKSIQLIVNSVVAVITLRVWNPNRGEWDCQDGVGAMPIQVDKDSKASDMSSLKSNAIQLAAPAAVSYAKKDAADNLGTIFGRNVARKDTIMFDPTFTEDPYIAEENVDKSPPPPAPLPASLAAKVITENTLLQVASQPAIQPEQAPVVDFTPPVFDASAFAAPVVDNQAEKKQPILPELNTKLDF
jgi:hypothetical protein